MPRTAVTQQHTHKIVTSQLVVCCWLWNVKCTVVTVYSFSTLLFLKYFLLEVLILILVVSTFSWDLHRAILVISCIILLFCATNLCFLFWWLKILVVRLIAIKLFNRAAALELMHLLHMCWHYCYVWNTWHMDKLGSFLEHIILSLLKFTPSPPLCVEWDAKPYTLSIEIHV